MRWKFFLGACFLTGAIVLPHTRMAPVITGMALAGLIQAAWWLISGR